MVPSGRTPGQMEEQARRMAAAIEHRGPDGGGTWADAEGGIALSHRRLSIIDLSAAGHQPMVSAMGRYVITFNGEVYNHIELREQLRSAGVDCVWRGHSDTETLLAAFEHWGVEATLARAVGMFAIALWDRRDRVLHLMRDRFGEKPLYYGWTGDGFVFGSELKALRASGSFTNPICRQALVQYLRFLYVPAPRSIHEGIYKLEPGCLLTIEGKPPARPPAQPLQAPARHGSLRVKRWWSLAQVVEEGARTPLHDEKEAVGLLEARLIESVKLQSLADVPLGAFLSGGVDSAAIVALMQHHSSRPVKTFTVGFEEAGFDESPQARAVARHLGTEHTELFVSAAEARGVIQELPAMYDEPFADSSQIPTHLVCRAARQHVTVALSGDGGDELFGGYNRYFWAPRLWRQVGWMPYPIRRLLAVGISRVPAGKWDAVGTLVNRLRPGASGIARTGDKAHKLAVRIDRARNLDEFYLGLVSEWQDPACLVRGGVEPATVLAVGLPQRGMDDARQRMMFRDSLSYLPDDVLCKVDRAAMATSLETRVPFLDHRVAALAWRLPLSMKTRGDQSKWALRQVLYRHVPRELIERPKAGFAIPVGQWLRGPLREWAEALLDENRLRREGYLEPRPVRQAWVQHLEGRFDQTARLWGVLMFQAWLERQHMGDGTC